MSRRMQMLVWVLAVVGAASGCGDLEERLEGEPCVVADDCWHTQRCARTYDEAFYLLPGVCAPEGTGCVFGQQLGCQCNPNDPAANCTAIALPPELYATYPRMVCDPGLFLCVVAPQNGGQP